MADPKDTKVKTETTPDADKALESFLNRDQGTESAEKQTKPDTDKKKINKRILIIAIAVVAVAALVALLIFTRSQTKSEYNEDEATVHPADITLGVNADGEHTAQVALDEDGNIEKNGSGNLVSYVPADISRIDVENTDGSFSVTSKTPEGEATVYTLVGFEDYPMQSGIADGIATDASAMAFTKIISPDGNLADYGLDKPKAKVKVAFQDKTTAQLRVGSEAPGEAGTYIAFGDSDAVYLAAKDAVDSFMYSVNDFISLTVTDTPEDSDNSTFKTLTVSGSRYSEPITLEPNKDEAVDAAYIVTAPRRMYANAVESYDIAGSVRGLYAAKVVCVNPSDSQLEEYGLAEPYAEVDAVYPDAEIKLSASQADDSGNAYLFNPAKKIVYSIQQATLSWAKTSVEALMPQYVFAVKLDAVSGIKFSSGSDSYTIDVSTTTEQQDDEEGNTQDVQVTTATCDGKKLDSDNFQVFFQNLNAIENKGDNGSGGDEVLSFTYSYSTDRADDTVKVYDTGSAQYAVTLNGDIVGSASKSYIDSLISQPAALIKGDPVNTL